MSEAFISEVVTILLVFGIFALSILGIWVKRKYNVTKNDLEALTSVLRASDYIVGKFEFKYSDKLSRIIVYILEAIKFVEKYEDTSDLDIKKDLIKQKVIITCENVGFDVSDGFNEVVDELVEYFFK